MSKTPLQAKFNEYSTVQCQPKSTTLDLSGNTIKISYIDDGRVLVFAAFASIRQ